MENDDDMSEEESTSDELRRSSLAPLDVPLVIAPTSPRRKLI